MQELMYAFQLTPLRLQFMMLPSVSGEYIAVVSRASITQQYQYIGSCIDVSRTCTRSFSVMSFTQLKKKCFKKLTSLAVYEVYYYSYFIHRRGHSHTLTIVTGGARTCSELVMSREVGESISFCKHFSLVVWNSRRWNLLCKSVWHLCKNLCMDIAERCSHAILQLRIPCWLTESVVNCEQSGVHWKAYTSSCVCRRRECPSV